MNSSRSALREGRRAWLTTASRCSRASARRTDSSEPGTAQKPTKGWPLSSRAEALPFTHRMSVLCTRRPSRTKPLARARAMTSSTSKPKAVLRYVRYLNFGSAPSKLCGFHLRAPESTEGLHSLAACSNRGSAPTRFSAPAEFRFPCRGVHMDVHAGFLAEKK